MKRLSVNIDESGKVKREIETVDLSILPENELLIKVHYSSLNYKDALSANGHKGISKNYPHTPGIDASGVVKSSSSPLFKVGDAVIVTGFDQGMNRKGGFSEYISVPASWAIHLPKNLTLKESMILGTAGLTAAMAIDRILTFDKSNLPVLVTGATGGVGSLSIAIMKRIGLQSIAYSRRESTVEYLKDLGASEVIHSFDMSEKPLLKVQYGNAIDTVGGAVLETILKQVAHNGSVAVCGMALSPSLTTTVYPFILRGLNVFGIESAEADMNWRTKLWNLLANDWKPENLEEISRTVTLDNLESEIVQMLDGNALGRVVIELTD